MKKILFLVLTATLMMSLASCSDKESSNNVPSESSQISETTGLTNEQCIGTWEWSFEDSPDKTNFGGIETMELSDGGVGKGTNSSQKDGSYHPITWEIEDDVLKVSFTADPLTGAFYVDGDTMTSTDGGYVYLKAD